MPESPTPLSVRELKQLEGGRPFACVLLLKRTIAKTASNGNAFLSLELGDRTGSFGATLFGDHPQFETLKALPDGAALALFALGRTVGWIAHAIEQYGSDTLIRPRAHYIGRLPLEEK